MNWRDVFSERWKGSPFDDMKQNILHQSALRKYTRYYDEVINHGLRNDRLSETAYRLVKKIIEAVDNVKPLEHEMILFRGVRSTEDFKVENLHIGDIITDKGFTSKSSSVKQALKFSDKTCCLLAIVYPPGSKQISLTKISHFPKEKEFVTYPGEVFEIVDELRSGDGTKILILNPLEYTLRDLHPIIDRSIDKDFHTFLKGIKEYPVYFPEEDLLLTDELSKDHRTKDKLYSIFVTGRSQYIKE